MLKDCKYLAYGTCWARACMYTGCAHDMPPLGRYEVLRVREKKENPPRKICKYPVRTFKEKVRHRKA